MFGCKVDYFPLEWLFSAQYNGLHAGEYGQAVAVA